jgi:hypothetical protein
VGSSIPPPTLRQALEPWCAVGSSGAVRVVDRPEGAIYLTDGRVTYAESGLVSGVDRLLTASGKLPADVWKAAVAAARSGRPAGETLIGEGHLRRGELELVVLSALLDAALLMFDAPVETRFEPGAANPLDGYCSLDFGSVCREVDRRRRLLAEVWPDPAIDTAAVIPARRIAGHHVALTAVQWEIVANADRRRSPADLARLLGRETFVVLLEARRLAQAGLIEPGRPGGSAVAESVAAMRARANATEATEERASPNGPRAGAVLEEERSDGGRAGPQGPRGPRERSERHGHSASAIGTAPPLAVRRSGASLPPSARSVEAGRPVAECSESTLLRIRRALEAMR